MKELFLKLYSEDETIELGKRLAKALYSATDNFLISLSGPLGAGKTTFIKGFSLGLGVENYVESPTFVFLNIYKASVPVYHYDMYRVDEVKDIDDLGIFDMVSKKGFHLFEWGEKLKDLLDFDLEIYFKILDESSREVHFKFFRLEYIVDELSFT